jgi:hypothetical protein
MANLQNYKLAVNGSIGCRELLVTAEPWADYVLKPDYRLMPLESLEAYIKANAHLPGVPAAEEVAKKGVNVGEMQAKLLEKIEQLTLYVLELKRENEKIKDAIEGK